MESVNLEDLGIDVRIMLSGSSRSVMKRHGTDLSGSGWGQLESACECDNEPSGSIKCGEFFD